MRHIKSIKILVGVVALACAVIACQLPTGILEDDEYHLIISQWNQDEESYYYSFDPDGGELTQLTSRVGHDFFSPDGRLIFSIAYKPPIYNENGGIAGFHLPDMLIIDIMTGEELMFVENEGIYGGGYERFDNRRDADWSPDGSKVVYRSDRDASGGIKVYDLDADQHRILANGYQYNREPDWSPDGKYIIVISKGAKFGTKEFFTLFDMKEDNHAIVDLEEAGLPEDVAPFWFDHVCDLEWSPDSRFVAFHVGCSMPTESLPQKVYILDVETLEIHRVSEPEKTLERRDSFYHSAYYTWSTDSKTLYIMDRLHFINFDTNRESAEHDFSNRLLTYDIKKLEIVQEISLSPDVQIHGIVWSPDRTKIGWEEVVEDGSDKFIMHSFTDGYLIALALPDDLPLDICGEATWTPDSRYLAYRECGEEIERLIVLDTEEMTFTVIDLELAGYLNLIGWFEEP